MRIEIRQLPTGWILAAMTWCVLTTALPAAAANKVATVTSPDGGQAMVARADAQGTIHLVVSTSDGPRYARSRDGGQTFQKSIAIVNQTARKPGLEFTVWDMAVSPQGHVHIALGTNAWKLKLPQAEWGYYYTNLAPEATEFPAVRNINGKPSEGFSLAADGDGHVTACWLAGKLYANISSDHGQTFQPFVEIEPSFNPCDCCTTSIAYGADGKLAILYREETNDQRDMYLALWDQQAHKVTRTRVSSTLWKIDACPMTYYAVVPRGDGYAAVWPTKGQIRFARLDRQGKLLAPVEVQTPGETGMRTGMFVLNSPDGGTLVGWKKDDHLGWQAYDNLSKPVGAPGSIDSPGKGAAGVVSKDGRFILFR